MDAKNRLILEIEDEARETASYTGRARFAKAVLDALRAVPREAFTGDSTRFFAYENRPLPIGHGQTISQPYIVALMTDLLDCTPNHTILEIGTGSGYQAAVLSLLVKRVVSIEVIPELAQIARQRLAQLGYHNVDVHCTDGRAGWPLCAPYHGIIVTAATEDVPPALLTQLADGGRLVIPLGPTDGVQTLYVYTKTDLGVTGQRILDVRFVPLVDTRY